MSHMQSHRTAKYVAFHNCSSPQSFQQCMQKPKEHLQLAYTAKQLKASSRHGNLICAVFGVLSYWCIIIVSWKFTMIHRFCYLKCCWSASSQVFDADVWSNSIMQSLLHWTPATGRRHGLTPWISRLRCKDCTCCLPGEDLPSLSPL